MIPKAVKQLHLCKAFESYAVHLMECIRCSNDAIVYIRDNDANHISEFINGKDSGNVFVGHNLKETEICLLSIDHKLINNHPGGIADCAVFNTDIFCFVEFKTNAEGRSLKSVESTYVSAILQIENTLQLFIDKINVAHANLFAAVREVVCHIVVASKFPRDLAMEQNYAIAFAEKWNLELSFENHQYFS